MYFRRINVMITIVDAMIRIDDVAMRVFNKIIKFVEVIVFNSA